VTPVSENVNVAEGVSLSTNTVPTGVPTAASCDTDNDVVVSRGAPGPHRGGKRPAGQLHVCSPTAPLPSAMGMPSTHDPPLKHGSSSHTDVVQLRPPNPLGQTHTTPDTVAMHDLPSCVHAGRSLGGQMNSVMSSAVGAAVGAAVVVATEDVVATGALVDVTVGEGDPPGPEGADETAVGSEVGAPPAGVVVATVVVVVAAHSHVHTVVEDVPTHVGCRRPPP
jgi:hypothetical protein